MKKISFLFLMLFFTLSVSGIASAEPTNINEAISTANQELKDSGKVKSDYFDLSNKNNKPINNSLWESRRLFSYGQPYGMDPATGNNRYLGETMKGEAYTNTLFRHDAWEGGTINDRKWITDPWDDDEIKSYLQNNGENTLDKDNPFNNRPEYLSSIKRGIKEYFQPGGNVQLYFKDDGTPWHQYIHLIQPPTKYTWGMGRMWHKKADGSIWYLTIPMAPLLEVVKPIPDLSVTLEVDQFRNVKPGDQVTSTMTFMLNKDHPQPERAWLRLHHVTIGGQEYAVAFESVNPADALDANGYVTFRPGESKTYRYTFTVQDKPSKIMARINPVDTDQDKNWSNNRDEAPVTMQNLRVEITSKPVTAQPGQPVSVGARIFNDMPDMQVTRLIAKVNGKVVKDISNYDIISMQDAAVNFNMPDSDATVEFYINPDRDKPADEITYADNIAACVIKKIVPPMATEGNIKVTISAPSRVQPFENWNFRVNIEGRFPPPPPLSEESTTAIVSLKITGKAINVGSYHLTNGTWGDVVVDSKKEVDYQQSIGIEVPRGSKFSETRTFTFPATTGFPGMDYTINLHAKASWRDYNGEDTSKTMIFFKAKEPEIGLTL